MPQQFKIPKDLKQEAQDISCVVESIVEEEDKNEIVSTLNAVPLFEKVTQEKIMEEQQKDPILKLAYQKVTAGEKPKNISYHQNKT